MTGIVTATLDKLTSWLGAAPHQQDVVYSEASARKALSRRAFLRTAGAVAAGVVLADRVAEAAEDVAARYELRMTSYSQFVNRHPAHIMASMPVHATRLRPGEWIVTQIDACEFEPGSVWAFSTGDSGGQALVTAIDHSRGIITVDSEPS